MKMAVLMVEMLAASMASMMVETTVASMVVLLNSE
jgi:hypothetical protein